VTLTQVPLILFFPKQNASMKEPLETAPKAGSYALFAAFFVISTVIIALSPASFLYDEGYYFKYVSQLESKGLTLAYIKELSGPTGPLYGVVHKALAPVTSLQIVPMRVATNAMFALSGLLTLLTLYSVRSRNALVAPALAYAAPFAGVTFGLALTEVPAMLAASLGILVLVRALVIINDNSESLPHEPRKAAVPFVAFWWLALAGILLAAAVWGRQNYLAVLFALPILFVRYRSFELASWLVVTSVFGLLSGLLFYVWGGLVPEASRFVSDINAQRPEVFEAAASDGGVFFGLNPAFGILSLGYAAALFGFVAPAVFSLRVSILGSAAAASVLATLLLPQIRFLPSYDALAPRLGPDLIPVASMFFGALLAFFGLWLLFSIALRCCERMKQELPHTSKADGSFLRRGEQDHPCWLLSSAPLSAKLYLFSAVAWLAVLATNMKISHQFSSRYVVVALPFMLITAAQHFRWSPWSVVRLSVGFAASVAFLTKKYGWWG